MKKLEIKVLYNSILLNTFKNNNIRKEDKYAYITITNLDQIFKLHKIAQINELFTPQDKKIL